MVGGWSSGGFDWASRSASIRVPSESFDFPVEEDDKVCGYKWPLPVESPEDKAVALSPETFDLPDEVVDIVFPSDFLAPPREEMI